jgi:hypothetical protein
MRKRLITAVSALVIMAPALGHALCNFNFAGCDYANCGVGCTVAWDDVNTYHCYNSMDQCCECVQWVVHCNCFFGPGSGLGSAWYVFNNSDCVSGQCTGSGTMVGGGGPA